MEANRVQLCRFASLFAESLSHLPPIIRAIFANMNRGNVHASYLIIENIRVGEPYQTGYLVDDRARHTSPGRVCENCPGDGKVAPRPRAAPSFLGTDPHTRVVESQLASPAQKIIIAPRFPRLVTIQTVSVPCRSTSHLKQDTVPRLLSSMSSFHSLTPTLQRCDPDRNRAKWTALLWLISRNPDDSGASPIHSFGLHD